jgi:hypothetical protein
VVADVGTLHRETCGDQKNRSSTDEVGRRGILPASVYDPVKDLIVAARH